MISAFLGCALLLLGAVLKLFEVFLTLCVLAPRYASEVILPKLSTHHIANVPSLKELTDFQQLPENPLDMLGRLFWVGVSLLDSDFEHEFLMAIKLLEKVCFSLFHYLLLFSLNWIETFN